MDQINSTVDKRVETTSGLKGKALRPAPSVIKMMESDPELKAFFRLIKENDFRDKALSLLNERLKK